MLANILCLMVLAAASTIAANPDAARTPQNTPVTTPVLANDTGSGSPLDPGSVTIITPSAHGTAAVNPDGSVTFTPAPGFTGTTTYSYRVCDNSRPTPVCDTAVVTITVTAAAGAGVSSRIRISIRNEYDARLDFGVLGKGSRTGTDRAEGVLERRGSQYVGIVTASVDSTQTMAGLTGSCGPANYRDSQKLRVTGYPESQFNPQVQSVHSATIRGQASSEFLRLVFAPETMTSQQPGPRLPPSGPQDPFLEDLVISCHTLIDTTSGIAFLPLNDSRWTTEGIGYIILLPSSGTLNYTDNTVDSPGGAQLGPFMANKSVWTIEVERL
jgi:hypothetical protein